MSAGVGAAAPQRDGSFSGYFPDGFGEHAGGSYFPDEPQRVLAAHKDDTAEEICVRLRESMIARAPLQDDASVVVVKYTP